MAATAGSRLIRMAKVEAGRRRRASSSRVYGRTEDSTATAAPSASVVGPSSFVPDSAMPSGTNRTAATTIASASPSACGKRRPVRALKTMYAAHMAPAASAKATPTGSRPVEAAAAEQDDADEGEPGPDDVDRRGGRR